MKVKNKTRWYEILSWIFREVITLEEGVFLFRQEIKGYFLMLKEKEYSLR